MRSTLLVAFLLVSLLPLAAADLDPWIGKSRDDLLAVLGEPNKTKKSDAGQLLVFKLVRLEEDSPPPSGMQVLKVPGVKGMLGLMPPKALVPTADSVSTMGPEDKYGRGGGGDVETSESHSISWSKEDGLERSWDEQPAIRGRLTLKFTVDAAGNIVDWSVSPKKAAE